MNAYICKGCGQQWFSAAGLEELTGDECPECGGQIRPVEADGTGSEALKGEA
jgi:hypothetical protein